MAEAGSVGFRRVSAARRSRLSTASVVSARPSVPPGPKVAENTEIVYRDLPWAEPANVTLATVDSLSGYVSDPEPRPRPMTGTSSLTTREKTQVR